jgi:hypothetical protein
MRQGSKRMDCFMSANDSWATVVQCGVTDSVYSKFVVRLQKWCNLKLKLMNEFAVDLRKTNNLCNITDNFRLRPVFKELMLTHSGAIAVQTNIDTNEFKAFGKGMTFKKAE